jgi:hypothetical protein
VPIYELAALLIDELICDMADDTWPIEVRSLGRTLKRWRDQITAWHTLHIANGPTESMNNLAKRVKSGVRIPLFQELPNPRPALGRKARLAFARDDHTTLRSEVPEKLSEGIKALSTWTYWLSSQ